MKPWWRVAPVAAGAILGLAVTDNVCTRCWKWFPGTVRACPECGVPLTAANAAGEPPPLALPHAREVDVVRQPPLTSPSPPDLPHVPEAGVVRHPRRHGLRWTLALCIVLVFALGIFPLPQLGLWGSPGCSFPGTTCTRVLFIGNSYTYVNDLPTTFADLAWAGGHRVQTGALAEGGSTLAEHAAAPETAATLDSQHWDVVVLQDQSQLPSLAVERTDEMYPAATKLVAMVRNRGARPMFYLTFAHKDGWPEEGLPDYPSMQAAINAGYLGIAGQLNVPVAPVGVAWQMVVDEPSPPSLWQSDGSHPTVSGTYLAACVFYAAIFQKSPVGLGDDDGLSASEASNLQTVAADTVLGDPTEWGLSG
jgi:hypothetical protein